MRFALVLTFTMFAATVAAQQVLNAFDEVETALTNENLYAQQ